MRGVIKESGEAPDSPSTLEEPSGYLTLAASMGLIRMQEQ